MEGGKNATDGFQKGQSAIDDQIEPMLSNTKHMRIYTRGQITTEQQHEKQQKKQGKGKEKTSDQNLGQILERGNYIS